MISYKTGWMKVYTFYRSKPSLSLLIVYYNIKRRLQIKNKAIKNIIVRYQQGYMNKSCRCVARISKRSDVPTILYVNH